VISLPKIPSIRTTTLPRLYDCEAGWEWRPRPLTDFDLWWVLAGRGSLTRQGATHPLRMGTCFLFRPGDTLVARHDSDHPLRVFAFHFEAETPWRKDLLTWPAHKFTARWDELEHLARQAAHPGAQKGRHAAARLWLAAQSCLLFYADMDDHPYEGGAEALERAAETMRMAPGKVPSIEVLSGRAGMSFAHFSRAFKRHHGVAPKPFLIRIKMERAAELLSETTMTLDEISSALGYGDGFQFSRQFSRWFGCAPGAWRKKAGMPDKNSGHR